MAEETLCEEVYNWVNELELSKPKKNFARDFSDGVIVAEILKREFPRLVELHNYVPANSLANKMKNWSWLNEKVLRKIGLGQSYCVIRDVASSKRSAVEKLLLLIKKKLDDVKEEKKKKEYITEEVVTEVTLMLEGIVVVDIRLQSTVPYEDFKIIQEELSRKEDELHALAGRVAHLEALVSLKDQRLADLAAQIKRCTCHHA